MRKTGNIFMWKKSKWPLELLFIIGIISMINQSILFIGGNDIYSLITGYIINIIGLLSLLIFAIFKINEASKIDNHSLHYFATRKFTIKDVLLVLLLFILSNIIYVIVIKIEFIHVFDMNKFTHIAFNYTHRTSFQTSLIVLLIILIIIAGVFAEELYFRCYLFEIQYKHFKNYTWLINGLSWSIFHIFSPRNFLAFLPTCLLYSYIYQRRRNIWITICAHLINNFVAFYPVIKTYIQK